jgi:hypothetical protein
MAFFAPIQIFSRMKTGLFIYALLLKIDVTFWRIFLKYYFLLALSLSSTSFIFFSFIFLSFLFVSVAVARLKKEVNKRPLIEFWKCGSQWEKSGKTPSLGESVSM